MGEGDAAEQLVDAMERANLLAWDFGISFEQYARLHDAAWAEALGMTRAEFSLCKGKFAVTVEQGKKARAFLIAACWRHQPGSPERMQGKDG